VIWNLVWSFSREWSGTSSSLLNLFDYSSSSYSSDEVCSLISPRMYGSGVMAYLGVVTYCYLLVGTTGMVAELGLEPRGDVV
jgi:hypothetical protein